MRITEYKVVETSTVTDDRLTSILNEMTREGWVFDGMTFVPSEASKRPRMAFVIFTRDGEAPDEQPYLHTGDGDGDEDGDSDEDEEEGGDQDE